LSVGIHQANGSTERQLPILPTARYHASWLPHFGQNFWVHCFAEVSLAGRAPPITERKHVDARQGDEKDCKKRVGRYTHRGLIRVIAKPHCRNHKQHKWDGDNPLPIATFFKDFNILLGLKIVNCHLLCVPHIRSAAQKCTQSESWEEGYGNHMRRTRGNEYFKPVECTQILRPKRWAQGFRLRAHPFASLRVTPA
jgi:hypothetical protein